MNGGTVERAHVRVDLAALRHNARVLLRAASGARLMAVVKADGYGHGAVPVARAALEAGASALAVATVAELECLRGAGVDAPVLVMGPLTGAEWARAAGARGAVTVWTPEGAAAAIAAGVEGLHLKVDTGMGRLGARPEDVPALVAAVAPHAGRVRGLMTHLATADEREGPNAGFMREQMIRFRAAVRDLREVLGPVPAHAANSAGVLRDPAAGLDMVRCGIALYGCSPFNGDPGDDDLRPVMSVVSRIASVKVIRSRESVGYGRAWRAARGTFVGVVPVGYADGYPRAMGNRAEVLVDGRRVPVVGNVSMDQLTVDLGHEPSEGLGSEVVLLGTAGAERITAEELAAHRGSINYEVTCGFGPRLPRVHHG